MTIVEYQTTSPRMVSVDDAMIAERRHRWTTEEYLAIGELDGLLPNRTELIDGEIIDVASQKDPHVVAISKTLRLLVSAFDESYWLTVQSTVKLPSGNVPEPDFAVRTGPATVNRDVLTVPLLVIEVSDTTLLFDRLVKGGLYAQNGIEDYWIVNLEARCVEVMRRPVRDESRKFGWRYDDVTIVIPSQTVSPVAKPDITFDVARMLP